MESIVKHELLEELRNFTGSERYYRYGRKAVLTDGVKYLAERGCCYWLIDVFVSFIHEVDYKMDSFLSLKAHVKKNSALVIIDDGDGKLIAHQEIEFTDLPLDFLTLYACWEGEFWVLMLPNEY